MFRLTYLTFYGTSRMDHHTAEHVHESPMVMIGPLVVLATLSVIGGSGVPPENGWFHHFLAPVAGMGGEHEREHRTRDMLLMAPPPLSHCLAGGSPIIFIAASHCGRSRWQPNSSLPIRPCSTSTMSTSSMTRCSWNRRSGSDYLCDWFDRTVIDGLVRSVDAAGPTPVSAGITWTEKHVDLRPS